jgi:mRNA-degrading endonuclease RelE of RelBE toxin-antitoxin system
MRKSRKTDVPASSSPSPETSKISWRIKLTERFLREIGKLPKEDRSAVNQDLMAVLPAWGSPHAHRGVGIQKLGADLFECRAGLRLRMLFKVEKKKRELIFFEIGNHDEIRRLLKS